MTTTLVKGTPVVSLADGSTLGTIDHVYFDPERLAVVGFTFHQGGGLFGGGSSGLVDTADVHAFGPDAVTIDDVAVVHSELAVDARRADLLDLEALLHRDVITAGGMRIGHVGAVLFGDVSYRLSAVDVVGSGADARVRIGAEAIRTIGEAWIVVADPDPVSTADQAPQRTALRVVTTPQAGSRQDGLAGTAARQAREGGRRERSGSVPRRHLAGRGGHEVGAQRALLAQRRQPPELQWRVRVGAHGGDRLHAGPGAERGELARIVDLAQQRPPVRRLPQ